MNKKLSIVISVFNEEEMLPDFFSSIKETIGELSFDTTLIFVDDGSTDASSMILDKLALDYPQFVCTIHLSRNYGHEAAMIAGIDHAKGDVVICMDADLQHPPAMISKMLEAWSQGNHIVTMVRKSRGDGGIRKFFGRIFYGILTKLSGIKFDANASDFFLISSRVASVLREDFRERTRFIRGYIQIMGFKKTCISYEAPARAAGKSKYSMRKLYSLSTSAIATFSEAPLNISIFIGILMGLISIIVGIYSLVMYFVDTPVTGYTTTVVLISFVSAIQLFVIGILGKYIGYLFNEVKRRPIYIVEKKNNLD